VSKRFIVSVYKNGEPGDKPREVIRHSADSMQNADVQVMFFKKKYLAPQYTVVVK